MLLDAMQNFRIQGLSVYHLSKCIVINPRPVNPCKENIHKYLHMFNKTVQKRELSMLKELLSY